MIGLLPWPRIIALVASSYAALVVATLLAVELLCGPLTLATSLKVALAGGGAVQMLLLVWVSFGWRWLWNKVPFLNRLLFPDFGGKWDMEIHWHKDGTSGVANATALIRQDFLRLSMDVAAPDSDSQTLTMQPKRDPESGRPMLYYTYLVTPRATNPDPNPPYHGAAILKCPLEGWSELRGNCWTDLPSKGHFVLTRQPNSRA